MNLKGNILILTQWSFKDALVQTYTLPYVDIIRNLISKERKIILVTAEQLDIALTENETQEVNKQWEEKNMLLVPQPYKKFGLKKIIASAGNLGKLGKLIKREKIKIIHAFCTPAGSIGYLLSKISGADLIIDSYEPHAESMVENGTWKKNGTAFKILFTLEKKQTKKASTLIATTQGMKEYAKRKYGINVKNFFVKPACVDLNKFKLSVKDQELMNELGLSNKIVCVYAGKLGGIYLKKEVFEFIKACYDHWKNEFKFLMLTNASSEEIEKEMERVGLPNETLISKFVFHNEIPRYLLLGDFALNPVKPVPTKRFCTSIKDGEYWATGLPVVISPNISDDSGIIEANNTGVVLNYSDPLTFKNGILSIEALLKDTDLRNRVRQQAIQYRSFEIAENIYRKIYC